ncbi:hypothetical protein [Amycolatopsis japonica]
MAFSVAGNDIMLAFLDELVGEGTELQASRTAFETTAGGFDARFRAAVQARVAEMVRPEVFIEIPEKPDRLTRDELDALVRPAAEGFLRSHPTKGQLLQQVDLIRHRQEKRPAWIPRIDRHGDPLPAEQSCGDEQPGRRSVVAAFSELGDVTVELPAEDDRPELTMETGGIGELELVLHTVLGTGRNDDPRWELPLDAQANEALVPEAARWWTREPPQERSAADDPGVASELLATLATLGNRPIEESAPAAVMAAVDAVAAAGDWRYSPMWRLDSWAPGQDAMTSTVARAAIAGWAEDGRSGLVVYVDGGAFHSYEGVVGSPGPLHSYLLCVSRSAATQDGFDAVHRYTLSCPGEDWCRRGGCVMEPSLELEALLRPLLLTGMAVDVPRTQGEQAYRQLYGSQDTDYLDTVLDIAEAKLAAAGWATLGHSSWDGGIEDVYFRRGEHCLTVAYDPVTRHVRLTDGRPELEVTLQMLAEEGVLTGEEGAEVLDTGEDAVKSWGADLLDAAKALLQGRISPYPGLDDAVGITLLGLHPHADGSLHGPGASDLVDEQMTALLTVIGVRPADEAGGSAG